MQREESGLYFGLRFSQRGSVRRRRERRKWVLEKFEGEVGEEAGVREGVGEGGECSGGYLDRCFVRDCVGRIDVVDFTNRLHECFPFAISIFPLFPAPVFQTLSNHPHCTLHARVAVIPYANACIHAVINLFVGGGGETR